MTSKKQASNSYKTDSLADDCRALHGGGERESVAVLTNRATNNSNNTNNTHDLSLDVKFLRFGVDSLYLSYQAEIFESVDEKLSKLKLLARSDNQGQQAKAQYKIGDHLFEVKDKGTSMFAYILEDNAFRIQLSRPKKSVPMAYVKVSSEYLTYKTPADAEKSIHNILTEIKVLQSSANVSRIDLYVDFVSHQNMEAWTREAWVTRAGSIISSYAINKQFTGWAIGMGGVIGARLYDKLFEIVTSHKGYLIPLWEAVGRLMNQYGD